MPKASSASRLVLYKAKSSPPSSAVMMLGDILGLDFELKEPDISMCRSSELKKITPMCTIPILLDGDLTIRESHAMLIYLTTKYRGEKRKQLYFSDFNTRAIIHHLMFWDTGVLFIRLKVPAVQGYKISRQAMNSAMVKFTD